MALNRRILLSNPPAPYLPTGVNEKGGFCKIALCNVSRGIATSMTSTPPSRAEHGIYIHTHDFFQPQATPHTTATSSTNRRQVGMSPRDTCGSTAPGCVQRKGFLRRQRDKQPRRTAM